MSDKWMRLGLSREKCTGAVAVCSCCCCSVFSTCLVCGVFVPCFQLRPWSVFLCRSRSLALAADARFLPGSRAVFCCGRARFSGVCERPCFPGWGWPRVGLVFRSPSPPRPFPSLRASRRFWTPRPPGLSGDALPRCCRCCLLLRCGGVACGLRPPGSLGLLWLLPRRRGGTRLPR